jgi:hypothetical protein
MLPITIDCGPGTVQLADALELNTARTFKLTSGTFDAVSYNVTAGRVSLPQLVETPPKR